MTMPSHPKAYPPNAYQTLSAARSRAAMRAHAGAKKACASGKPAQVRGSP